MSEQPTDPAEGPRNKTVCATCLAAQAGHKLFCHECSGVALIYFNRAGVASAFVGIAPPAPAAPPEEPAGDGPAEA